MFEFIGTLFTIAFWAAAIFMFGTGLLFSVSNLIAGTAWKKFMAIIAIILGVLTFVYVYSWLESIVVCLLATGMVLTYVADFGSGELESPPQREPNGGFVNGYLNAWAQKELMKEAAKEAIRELDD